ncbi:serine/threonine protein phosphatase, partial [Nakamurella silvestris]
FLRIGLSELDWIEKTQQGEHSGELVEIKCNIER